MNNNIAIEKLSKDNYDSWKLQIEAVLVKNDLWNFVIGEERIPDADDAAIAKWTKNDRKARADIILSIQPSELSQIKSCTTSHELWTKLKNIYESKGPARKATLLKQLLFSKMTDSKSMNDHINEFFILVDKLKEMEIDIADDLLTILLLYSIPESYENFRIAIESRDELPTPETLKIKLLEEANARKNKEFSGIPDSQRALYFKENRKFEPRNENHSSRSGKYTPKFKCNYCGIFGHKASLCRKKQANKKASENHKSSKNNSAMLAKICESKEQKVISDAVLSCVESKRNVFCFDSGATSHMCFDKNLFTELNPVDDTYVKLAVDKTVKAQGKGTVKFEVPVDGQTKGITLENVLYIPDLKNNLISISKITSNNYTVKFQKNHAYVINSKDETVLIAKREKELYYVTPIFESVSIVKEIEQWHLKFGHLNENDLKKLQKHEMVHGINFKSNDSLPDCKICIEGKQTATSFSKQSKRRCSELLGLIYSDLCGPMRVESLGRSFYFATFIDDYSRFVHVYFLRSKDHVKSAFLKFKAYVENKLNCKIKTLHTDNGLEYMGKEFDQYLENNGIARRRSCAYTPQMNPVAERENRTIVSMARCLLLQSKLPTKFWAEAVNTAVYIRNRCPTRSLNEMKTPFEMFFGRRPTVKHFKTFGQKAFVLDKKPQKGKFDARSKECIFIGYSDEHKVYRLWDPEAKIIVTSRDVKFIDEFENSSSFESDEFFYPECLSNVFTPEQSETETNDVINDVQCKEEHATLEEDENDENSIRLSPPLQSAPGDCVTSSDENKDFAVDIQTRGPGRPKKIRTGQPGRPKKEYSIKKEFEEAQIAEENNIIPSLSEALNSPYATEWVEAMQKEHDALVKNKAWKLVKRPENKKVIGSRWVLRTKFNPDGSIAQRKARLVAKGFAQVPHVDYEETFAPVARPSSIRTVMAYCAENNLKIFQLDFVMAYVNGDLEEEIYMEQAEKFVDKKHPDFVCLLQKSLYGLKQAGRQWFRKLDLKLKSFGLSSLSCDKCVYKMKTDKGELIIIVYVDDLIVCTNNIKMYLKLKEFLSQEFEIKDLGKLHFCLGIEFFQNENNGCITMSQSKYIDNILKKFNMQNVKPVKTPLDPSFKLTKEMCPSNEAEKAEMLKYPYRSLIGSLMYLAVCTRPDICHSVSYLSQFNENPGNAHWLAAKRVLKYLKGTQNYGLTFKPTGKPLIGFADADWGSDITDRKSYSGCVFKFADAAISWESKKQHCVALSSTEAEYISLSECAKETVYLRRFLNELSDTVNNSPTVVYSDSQGAQKLVKNPTFHSRTKHIDIRCHYIREVYERGELTVSYVPTEKMAADILTKTLTFQKFHECCKLIGIDVI